MKNCQIHADLSDFLETHNQIGYSTCKNRWEGFQENRI